MQRSNGFLEKTTREQMVDTLKRLWDSSSNFSHEVRINPDVYAIYGTRVLDYSGIPNFPQVSGLMEAELADLKPEEEIILVLARNEL